MTMTTAWRIVVVTAAAGCILAGTGARADLTDMLREKGILSEAEVQALGAEKGTASFPVVRVGGRLMIDAAGYDSDDADLTGGTEVRRGRLFAKGKVAEDWFFKVQYDFVDSGAEGLRDFYIGYAGLDDVTILVGQMIEAASLEDTMSSRFITFMERGLPMLAFAPATRRMGVRVDTHGSAWHAAAGVFGDTAGDDESEDEGVGVSARLTCAPLHAEGKVIHLGVSAAYRDPRGDAARFRARPEAHVDDTRLVDTGSMTNVNATVRGGLEAACVIGPVSVQAEYMSVDVDRADNPSVLLDGFYVYASWFLTGESRAYDMTVGEFVRLRPKRDLGDGGQGAWEIGARYSALDLDDEVRGGREENVTLGLNWYVNAYTRFMLNYVHVDTEHDDGDVSAHIGQVRAQMDF